MKSRVKPIEIKTTHNRHVTRPEISMVPELVDLISQCHGAYHISRLDCVLFCRNFFSTSCVATDGTGYPIGYVLGYRLPDKQDTLFIPGAGVASVSQQTEIMAEMLFSILKRKSCAGVEYIETILKLEEKQPWINFKFVSEELGAIWEVSTVLKDNRMGGIDNGCMLLRIGPFRFSA